MALQKVNRNLLNTGVSDSSDATAITIDSSENVTFSGTISNSGDTNGEIAHRLQNVNAGNAAESTLYITNAASNAAGLALGATGTGFTAAGGFVQDGGIVGTGTGASGGLSIMTRADAPIRFYTNGHTNERVRIASDGGIGIGHTGYSSTLLSLHNGTGRSTLIYGDSGDANCDISLRDNSSTQNIVYGATGDNHVFKKDTTEVMRIDSSGDIIIGSTSKIYSSGDSDSYLQFNQANTLRAVIGDSTRMIIGTGETVFNEDSGNFDFRIESDDNTNMFFIDANANQVFVNGNSAGVISNFETKLGTSRHDQSQTATNLVSGSGQPARYACGTQIVNSSGDVGTKLIIPMTSQVNLWRPVILKLIGTSAEYNYSAAGNRGFEVCVGFSLLNSINNLTEISRTGNCSSVTADGMNLEFNFSNAYDDGLSSYNGVVFHYEILGITPEYVQVWNASFN